MAAGEKHRLAKGIPWLVEALQRLAPTAPPRTCWSSTTAASWTQLAGRYRIHELGWVEDESRVAEALSAADVFVMPSLAESFGMMALESMACGTPVITSEGTATAELVRAARAGLCVPPRDGAALARGADGAAGATTRAVAAMGAAGRAIVEAEYSAGTYRDRHVRPLRGAGGTPRRRHGEEPR